ncbi:MAG: PhnD/SsuA/transferrin family substrate-binding protein [Gammaproteobacteria bacterium]
MISPHQRLAITFLSIQSSASFRPNDTKFKPKDGLGFALILGFLLFIPAPSHADSSMAATERQAAALKFGVYPYSFTSRIAAAWQPLADYLQHQLKQPVVMVSAPDSETFIQRASRGDYFLYLSAPHTAAWLSLRGEALAIRSFQPPLYGQLLTTGAHDGSTLADFAGAKIATADTHSYIAELLEFEITQLNNQAPFHLTVVHKPSHTSAVRALLNGEVSAAYIGPLPRPHLPANSLDQVKILEKSRFTANAMFLTPAASGTEHANRMTEILDKFINSEPEVKGILPGILSDETTRFTPVKQQELKQLAPLVEHWRSHQH